jgi:hypothetical protein
MKIRYVKSIIKVRNELKCYEMLGTLPIQYNYHIR